MDEKEEVSPAGLRFVWDILREHMASLGYRAFKRKDDTCWCTFDSFARGQCRDPRAIRSCYPAYVVEEIRCAPILRISLTPPQTSVGRENNG